MKDKDQNMYLNKSFDQFGVFLQVLQPIFSLWAIMAHTRVITSFQSSSGIGLITTQNFFFLIPGQDKYKDSGNAKILFLLAQCQTYNKRSLKSFKLQA